MYAPNPLYENLPLRGQLLNNLGTCWEAEYLTPTKNAPGNFRAKGD